MSAPKALVAGRYQLVSVIATGGMGVVWEAFDERLERSVALKQLHTLPGVSDEEAQLAKDRAMREARITARLHHPHAVPVFDAVEHEGQPCLVMQLLPSTPLSTVLRDGGPLPVGQVARIGHEIASALAAAHGLGIVHRDVKPGNVLLTPDGVSHISDFGISHAMGDATLTRTGMLHGTPAYLAPEAARGEEASFPSDVFSLGSTLYAALEGAPPFGLDGNSIALLHKVAAADVPAPTRAGELTPFLLDMLSADPGARPTMAQVAERLARLSPDSEQDVRPLPPPVQATPAPSPAGGPDSDAAWFFPEEPADAPRPTTQNLPASRPASRPTSAPPPSTTRGRRPSRGLLVAGAAVAAALVLLVAALTDSLPGGSEAARESAAPTASATPPPTSAASTATPTATPSMTPSPRETTASPQPSTPTPAPDRAAALSAAISDYYALLPDDTAGAWPRLTAGYQASPSGGRSSFESFWGAIDEVTVSDVRPQPPDRVEATLRYAFANGRVSVERTRYRLVEEGGVLKIAASEVLSSRRG